MEQKRLASHNPSGTCQGEPCTLPLAVLHLNNELFMNVPLLIYTMLLCDFFSDAMRDKESLKQLLEYDTQLVRKERVKMLCQNSSNKKTKFQKVTLVTNPDKTLAYCHVPKAASSAWMLIFAHINKLEKKPFLWPGNFSHGL